MQLPLSYFIGVKMEIRIATERDTENLEIIYNYFLQDMARYDAKATDLYVIPSKRNRGIASAFIRCVIQYAEKKGITKIILKVDEENHLARSLYKSLGFKEQSIYQKRIVMQYG